MGLDYQAVPPRRPHLHRASLAFHVMDDFTNMPVRTEHVKIHIPYAAAPVRKNDGYYVFIDLEEGDYTVYFQSSIYCQMTLKQVRVRLDEACPILTVRMVPGISYRLPPNAARLIGIAPPNSSVWAAFQPKDSAPKLLYNYDGGDIIRIFAGEMKSLEGRSFCIQDKEFFNIVQTLDSNERVYLLDHKLEHTYARNTARLVPVSWTQADEHGKFFLSFYGIGKDGMSCKVGIDGTGQQPHSIMLYAGKTCQITL